LRGGGTADACRTVRRCTPCRSAKSRIDSSSRRRSRLIFSNNTTRDRTWPTSPPTTDGTI
jgi:hypothetical protein